MQFNPADKSTPLIRATSVSRILAVSLQNKPTWKETHLDRNLK